MSKKVKLSFGEYSVVRRGFGARSKRIMELVDWLSSENAKSDDELLENSSELLSLLIGISKDDAKWQFEQENIDIEDLLELIKIWGYAGDEVQQADPTSTSS